MAKEDCTNCCHAKWPVTKSGRRQLSKNGECTAVVLLPNCFMTYSDYMPTRNGINKYTCRSRKCALWSPVGKKINAESPENDLTTPVKTPAAPSPDGEIDLLYNELLLAVEEKYEGESRHQTALRLIRSAQSNSKCGSQLHLT